MTGSIGRQPAIQTVPTSLICNPPDAPGLRRSAKLHRAFSGPAHPAHRRDEQQAARKNTIPPCARRSPALQEPVLLHLPSRHSHTSRYTRAQHLTHPRRAASAAAAAGCFTCTLTLPPAPPHSKWPTAHKWASTRALTIVRLQPLRLAKSYDLKKIYIHTALR